MKLLHLILALALGELAAAAPQALSIGGQASAGAPRAATCVVVFHGQPGGPGDVRIYDDLTGAPLAGPAFLTQARLLPIDFVGRTDLTTFDHEFPRWRDDVPGAARLVLPGERGSLYHYARATPAGSRFGFLWLDPYGRPVVLGERPGTGAGGASDPYLRRIGVAPDGSALLVATTAPAGGDLLELELTSRRVLDRTPSHAPLHFSDAGLWLAHDWGFGVADEGVFRFARADSATAMELPYEPLSPPTWFAGEAVMSASRSFAAATAGAGPLAQYVWVFGAQGPAVPATRQPDALSGAGFLPESLDGPFLAVSDDGARAAWRSEGTTRELYFARTLALEIATHVSADVNFADTFDEIGQVSFFQPDEVTFGVGGRDEPLLGGLEKMDVYTARIDPNGTLNIENRSLTSGDSVPPFQSVPQITPEQARALPAGILMHEDDHEQLIALRHGQTGIDLLLDEVKEVAWIEHAGTHLVVCLRRTFGSKPWQLVRVSADLTGTAVILDPGGPDTEFLTPAPGAGGWVGYLSRTLTQDRARRVHAQSGVLETWNTTASTLTPPFGHSPLGHMLFTHGPGNGPSTFQLWPYGSATIGVQAPPGPGHVLPSR